jgi:trehalose 6-phosphate synthase
MSRLVIVSNRVPSLSPETSAGGLAVALKAALEECGGLWFGWSGRVGGTPDLETRIGGAKPFSVVTTGLSEQEFHGYYEEFAIRTLWPLFHGRLDLCKPDSQAYETYRHVNLRFARTLVPLLKPDDKIWVHDFHLIPLGQNLQGLGVTAPLGFFLHVPFPQTETLVALPWHRDLLSGLCAYDVVGFQTSDCASNFRDAVVRYLGASVRRDGSIMVEGRVVELEVVPIGIDTCAFKEMSRSAAVRRRSERLRHSMRECEWICGVERMDYTKGLLERFRAFEALLDKAPSIHRRVSLVQIAAPSRESLAEYQQLQSQLESLSGRINGRFGGFDWMPIHYLNRAYSQKQLAALYRVSRIGLVTPLRDGMNLVAKEYVAAQDPRDPGVLILSRFAGAARALTAALLVNPHDTSAVAEAIQRALQMQLAERLTRWKSMMNYLEANDVHDWRRAFLEALESAYAQRRDVQAAQAA